MKSRALLLATFVATLAVSRAALGARDTVKVGVLHSPGAAMTVSETSLQNVLLFAFDEINVQGGVLGKKIDPVMVGSTACGLSAGTQAGQCATGDQPAVVFTCWGSSSQKSALPVFEKFNGALVYPVQYEGEELSRKIFYRTVVANQQSIPVVDHLLGAGRKQFYLLGSDSVYPRTANKLLKQYLKRKGIPDSDIAERYVPANRVDYAALTAEIRKFNSSGRACVISTLNEGENTPRCREEFAAAGLAADSCPVMSVSLSEESFCHLPAADFVGHFEGVAYPLSPDLPENAAFAVNFKKWLDTAPAGVGRMNRVAGSQMDLARAGVYLWKRAVERAGSFDVDKVRAAMIELDASAPEGMGAAPANPRPALPAFAAAPQAKGQLKLVPPLGPVAAEPLSEQLLGKN